jgi:hypothetical protein
MTTTTTLPGEPLSRLRAGAGLAALLACVVVAAVARADEQPAWRELAAGLEMGRFDTADAAIDVLRIDPERWRTVGLAAADVGGGNRTAREWGREFGLTAVVNAGMYAADRRTHTGYFHTGDHVNNPRWNRVDYRQAACFEPRRPGLPAFTLVDLDVVSADTVASHYEVVVQNIRLIKKPGENRWTPSERRWAEVCLGEDDQGRLLWIRCREPLDMHTFNEILLDLPLDLVAAQHLEGGPPAQMWIDGRDNGYDAFAVAIPNVLGIVPR